MGVCLCWECSRGWNEADTDIWADAFREGFWSLVVFYDVGEGIQNVAVNNYFSGFISTCSNGTNCSYPSSKVHPWLWVHRIGEFGIHVN